MKRSFLLSLTLICLSILVSGCGKSILRSTDERLLPYVNEFEKEARIRGITLPELDYLKIEIRSASELPGYMGLCVEETGGAILEGSIKHYTLKISQMTIDRGDFETRVTIFHELGHCLLNRGHYDHNVLVNVNGSYVVMPVSIMGTVFFSNSQLPIVRLYWDKYVDELFGLVDSPFDDFVGR